MWLVAAVAVALLVLPWVIALALAHHHHLDATAVAILAAVSIPLSGLWLAWVTLAKSGGSSALAGRSLAEVADELAVAVAKQWTDEAAVRRLNDPWPLPVSWHAADPSLTDAWDSLGKLAASGAGWPEPPPEGTWAAGPDDLAGKDRELVEVLTKVPTGRLVVLGEPGAGKTMLMVRLVLDLLARRRKADGTPVPILTSVASWNPADQDLRDWLGAQLLIDYPALADPPPAGSTGPTQAAALLASGLILPVLDGLDEIPEHVRGPAISRINDALRPGERMVVTCRSKDYRDAVRPQEGVEVTLRAAAAVQLRPLDADAVRGYLLEDAGGPAAKARWKPVLDVLGTETPAGRALRTPLMVSLARAIYNPRPGELTGELRDPAELCDHASADQEAVESVLFDAFIPAAYRSDRAGRWKAQDAERWLMFLAHHLERKIASPDLAWWQLQQTGPRHRLGLWAGLTAGVVAGLAAGFVAGLPRASTSGRGTALLVGLWAGLAVGLVVGLAVGLVVGRGGAQAPARGVRIRVAWLVVGLVAGLVAGYLFTSRLVSGEWSVVVNGAVLYGGLGLLFGLVFGLAGVTGDLVRVTSPWTVLKHDRRVALLAMLAGGLLVGLVFGFVLGLVAGLGAAGLVLGIAAGIAAGCGLSMRRAAWPSYELTRGWLALRRRMPWSLMGFLTDAHQRGVLRQVGAVYQFRHIELQHRLANRDADKPRANSPAVAATEAD